MTVDIEKLEALAEAAIDQAKRWKDAGEPWPIWNKCLLEMQVVANPAAVLELITQNRALRKIFSDAPDLPDTDVEWLEKTRKLEEERDQLRKDASLHINLQRAAGELPGAWSIDVSVERHAGWVSLLDGDGCEHELSGEGHLGEQVSEALEVALEMSKEQSHD